MLNKLKKSDFLKRNKLLNGWVLSECSATAEILGSSKFNSITIDLQHGMIDFTKCKLILQILSKYNIFPMVRVPSNEIGITNKCLDAGAKGIICPLINNKKECFNFTNNCYYPPKGIRSFGPTIASINDNNYFSNSNKEILSIAMIETKESVQNLEEILTIDNLDMVYVGPYDLSISYGYTPNKVFEQKTMLNTYDLILNKASKFGKKTAIHCAGGKTAKFFLNKGFTLVTIDTDLSLFKKGLDQELLLLNK